MNKIKQIALIFVYAIVGLVSASNATVFDKAGVVTAKSAVRDSNDPNRDGPPPMKIHK